MTTTSTNLVAFALLAPLLALSACAAPAASQGAGDVRFALTTTTASTAVAPALRVAEVRVLGHHVNLRQPLVMGASEDGSINVTFARHQREGATLVIDPGSLEPRTTSEYAYPARAPNDPLPFLSYEPVRVGLADGSSVACWTDEASSRVMVQAFGANGTWRGSPVAASPEGMDVFGPPRAVSADGRHVVISFFTTDEAGFDLVAASLESVH